MHPTVVTPKTVDLWESTAAADVLAYGFEVTFVNPFDCGVKTPTPVPVEFETVRRCWAES